MSRFGNPPFYLSEIDYLKWKDSFFNELVEIYVFSNGDKIPADIVEKGKDWEQVKEFLLNSVDHYKIYEGDQVWYVNRDFEVKFWKSGIKKSDLHASTYKFFITEGNAITYANENKPKYSYTDMMNVVEHIRRNNGITPGNQQAIDYIVNNAPTKTKVNG